MLLSVSIINPIQSNQTEDCDEVITVEDDIYNIYSPGYDNGSYPENINCRWIIKTQPPNNLFV